MGWAPITPPPRKTGKRTGWRRLEWTTHAAAQREPQQAVERRGRQTAPHLFFSFRAGCTLGVAAAAAIAAAIFAAVVLLVTVSPVVASVAGVAVLKPHVPATATQQIINSSAQQDIIQVCRHSCFFFFFMQSVPSLHRVRIAKARSAK